MYVHGVTARAMQGLPAHHSGARPSGGMDDQANLCILRAVPSGRLG